MTAPQRSLAGEGLRAGTFLDVSSQPRAGAGWLRRPILSEIRVAEKQQGGISPTDFVSVLADLIGARTKEQSAVGSRRAVMARFERMGVHKPGLQLFLKLRDMEPDDAELTLASALRYCRWAQMKIGDQATLFPASDDAGTPAAKTVAALTEASAYEEGFAAGKGGRDANDSRFPAGTPMHARFFDGWAAGQEVLANQLGEERPADGGTVRRKAKGKDGGEGAEVREARPKGGGRRASKRGEAPARGARGGMKAAREHLGGKFGS